MGWEVCWWRRRGGLSRRGELKVNVCRHNGEGLLPHCGGDVLEELVLHVTHPLSSPPHICLLPMQPLAAPTLEYSAEVYPVGRRAD